MTNSRILSCPFPTDLNPLSPNGFKFSITKLPELSYFCQTASIPQLDLVNPNQKNSFVNIPIPGETLTYSPLTIEFLIDSQLANYKGVHNWLIGLGFPEDNQQFTDFINTDYRTIVDSDLKKMYSDGALTILNSAFRPIQTIIYKDLIPTSLKALTFTTKTDDVQYLVGVATFDYTSYAFA